MASTCNCSNRNVFTWLAFIGLFIAILMIMLKDDILNTRPLQTEIIPPLILLDDETVEPPENIETLTCPNIANIFHNSVILTPSIRNSFHLKYNLPLYLYSDGGSGNTWLRTLLEYITGIGTGSVFTDKQYQKSLFSKEGVCNRYVIVCKVHPIWFFKQMPPVKFTPAGVWKKTSAVIGAAAGLVWLIRDPWHSLWSLYQLRFTQHMQHFGRIKMNDWDADHFWMDIYMGLREISLAEKWKLQFEIVDILLNDEQRKWHNEQSRIVRIRYEDLLDGNKRYEEVLKIIKHLYFVNETTDFVLPENKVSARSISYEQLLQRIKCAFEYNYNSNLFHRTHDDNVSIVTMEYAFKSIGEHKLCKIWHSLHPYAKMFGYRQIFLNEFDCELMSDWNLIQDVDNVKRPNMTRFNVAIQRWEAGKNKRKWQRYMAGKAKGKQF